MTKTREIVFIISLLIVASATAEPESGATALPTYLFSAPNLPTAKQNTLYQKFNLAYVVGDYDDAEISMSALLTLAIDDPKLAPEMAAKLLSNAAVLQAQLLFNKGDTGHAFLALDQLKQATDIITTLDPFHPLLGQILVVTSLIHELQQDYAAALDTLRHAQHLIHRQHGVYAGQQLPIVERIANVSHRQGDLLGADREYMFKLRVGERAFGPDSPEQISMLTGAGNHFALRAASQPSMRSLAYRDVSPSEYQQMRPMLFRTAFQMYENAIRITELTYGSENLRLIQPLREMAYARILQGTSKREAENALERVLEIILANPGTDTSDHARALVALADIYTITGDAAAAEHYLQAWNLLNADVVYQDLQTTLFSTNRRLYPLGSPPNGLMKQPMSVEPGNELYVDLGYAIRENGRTHKVRVIDSNLPNAYKRNIQTWFQQARFRPRIEAGTLMGTNDLQLHHVYTVIGPLPPPSMTVTPTTDSVAEQPVPADELEPATDD
jgi:tetratricopeptide (TPR) repeat protein